MKQLSHKQSQLIQWYILKNGVTSAELREDLFDHICSLVESEMESGKDFDKALRFVLAKFGSLRAIQIRTDREIESSRRFENFIYCLNCIYVFVYFSMAIFFIMLPAWIFLSGAGFILSFCSLPPAILGFIIIFTRINYRTFDIIPFKKSFSPVKMTF